MLTWQQQHESCSGWDLAGSVVCLPRPRVSWHHLFTGPWDSQPGPGTVGTAPSPFPQRDPPSLPSELWAVSSFTISCCWLQSSISLAPNPHVGVSCWQETPGSVIRTNTH